MHLNYTTKEVDKVTLMVVVHLQLEGAQAVIHQLLVAILLNLVLALMLI